MGLSSNITARLEAQQALRQSEEKFRQLARDIARFSGCYPPEANQVLYVSPAYEQVWGRTCESLYNNPASWTDAIHPDDREQAHRAFACQLKEEQVNPVPEYLSGRKS